MAQRHLSNDGAAFTQVALTSAVGRTPSATKMTHVTVVADWNTIAASNSRTLTVTVGGVAFQPVAVHNADAVTARRHGVSIAFMVPPGVEYIATANSTSNLTLQAEEVYL